MIWPKARPPGILPPPPPPPQKKKKKKKKKEKTTTKNNSNKNNKTKQNKTNKKKTLLWPRHALQLRTYPVLIYQTMNCSKLLHLSLHPPMSLFLFSCLHSFLHLPSPISTPHYTSCPLPVSLLFSLLSLYVYLSVSASLSVCVSVSPRSRYTSKMPPPPPPFCSSLENPEYYMYFCSHK